MWLHDSDAEEAGNFLTTVGMSPSMLAAVPLARSKKQQTHYTTMYLY